MINWKEIREGAADLARADYTAANGRHVLLMGHLWKKSDSAGNNPMKKVCTSEDFREYLFKNYSQYGFEYQLWLDGFDTIQDVAVHIGCLSYSAHEIDAKPIYRTPAVYLSSDKKKRNIWESLSEEQKSDIENEAFLACGYFK